MSVIVADLPFETATVVGVSVRKLTAALVKTLALASLLVSNMACQSFTGLTLSLQPNQTFQTFHAWRGSLKHGPYWVDHSVSPPLPKLVSSSVLNRVLDDLVFDLGLTGVRINLPPRVETTNDNADPFSINSSGFNFDRSWAGGSHKERFNDPVAQMQQIILPLKRRVESTGVPFSSYVSLGLEKSEIPRHWDRPDEYAEVGEAFLTYLKKTFDFEPNFWVIYNEPDLAGFSAREVAANIAALGPRLKQKGFKTKIQYPETETPGKAVPWVNAVLSDPRVTPYLGMIAFHSYDYNWQEAPASFASRNALREQAKKFGVMTGSTETCCRYGGSSRSSYQYGLENSRDIYFNLTEADAAVWEPFSIMESCSTRGCPGGGLIIGFENDLSTYYKQAHYYANRQYMSYIRPGDTRVGMTCAGCFTTSAGQNVKPVVFRSPAGTYVAVVINDQPSAQEIQFNGFPAGTYRITGVDPRNPTGKRYPDQAIAAGQSLSLEFPAQGILTIAQTTSGDRAVSPAGGVNPKIVPN